MKKNDILKFSLFLLVISLGLSSCGKDKRPEIVEDPLANNIEYYVTGLVVSGTTPLSGVTVTAGDKTATTDANGLYSLTLKAKGTYTVSFVKDGYLSLTDGVAVIPTSATNRSSVSLDVVLSPLGKTTAVNVASTAVTVTELGNGDLPAATTGIILPSSSSSTTSFDITITPYVEAQSTAVTSGTTTSELALTNVVVTTSQPVLLTQAATLFFNNPATDGTYLSGVDFYKKSSTKASGSWTWVGDVTYDPATGKYKATIAAGNTLAGEYSIRVEATKTVSSTISETLTEITKSNADNNSAIYDFAINYSTKSGWDYTAATKTNLGLLNTGFANLLKEIITEQEGGVAGVRTRTQTAYADISGGYYLYFVAQAQYANITYTVKTSTNLSIVLGTKKYSGNTFTYTLNPADSHSGGHSGGSGN